MSNIYNLEMNIRDLRLESPFTLVGRVRLGGRHENALHLIDLVTEKSIDFLGLKDKDSVNLPTGAGVELLRREVACLENCILPGGNIQEMCEVGIAAEPYM